jgi:hypothetical protein
MNQVTLLHPSVHLNTAAKRLLMPMPMLTPRRHWLFPITPRLFQQPEVKKATKAKPSMAEGIPMPMPGLQPALSGTPMASMTLTPSPKEEGREAEQEYPMPIPILLPSRIQQSQSWYKLTK